MSTHTAESEDQSRRATATGDQVVFMRRKPRGRGYAAPVPVWNEHYSDHAEAIKAAEAWAMNAKIRKGVNNGNNT